MSNLKLVPAAPDEFTEAQRGDLEALRQLLASAACQSGFGYKAQAENVAAIAQEADDLPSSVMTWRHLAALNLQRGEMAAQEEWKAIKQMACEELASGSRAASVIVGDDATPIERARFAVLRESLAAEWVPRNGIEWNLIDQLTQAATAQSFWTQCLTQRIQESAAQDMRDLQALSQQEKYYKFGSWIPQRISEAEAQQEAMSALDKWNRIFLRVLRQLRDLRRFNVVIQNAGQVNLASQQVNVSQQEGKTVQKPRAKKRHPV